MGYAQEVEHTSKIGNLSGENTQLSIDVLYNNPTAIIVAIPLDSTKKLLKYPVGVWNNGVHCYIFNEDRSPMKEGMKFKIIYALQPDSAHFVFEALYKTLKGDVAYIDRSVLNGNPEAQILASMSENPSGVKNKSDIGFKYDDKEKMWYVYNLNGTPVPKDLGINIIVEKPKFSVKGNQPIIINEISPIIKVNTLTALVTKDVEFPNWNFEKGLSGWGKEGTAFNSQPTSGDNITTQRILYSMDHNNNGIGGDYWKDQGFNNGYKDKFWIGTYENNPDGRRAFQTQGDAATGILTSDEVLITTSFCYFLIGGGADAQRLYIELQTKLPDGSWKREAVKSCFRSSEQFYREKFSLQGLQNQTARIRIVDNSTGNWGHINADNFRFTNYVLPAITLTDPVTKIPYEVDEDAPVWGFADTHAHPANELGFGKRLIIGKANAPLSETYSNTLCHNNHTTFGNGILNTPFIGGADIHRLWTDGPTLSTSPNSTVKHITSKM